MTFRVSQEEIEQKLREKFQTANPDAIQSEVPPPEPETEISLEQIALENQPDFKVKRPEGVPDVKQVFLRRAKELGVVWVAKITGRPLQTVRRWLDGTAEPALSDLQKFLDQPTEREWQVNRALLHLNVEKGDGVLWTNKPKLSVAVLMASNRDVPKPVMLSAMYYVKNDDVQWFYSDQPILVHARNELAQRLLDTSNEYGLFWDDDVFPPFTRPDLFYAIGQPEGLDNRKAGFNAIHQLLSHRKDIVGAVYSSRRKNGPLTIQPDLAPKGLPDKELADEIRSGKSKGLLEVDWLATGFTLIHRRVFEGIVQKNLAPIDRVFPTFFNPVGNEGEDFSFCMRARKAGFKCHIDGDLIVGHIGRQVFFPADSKRPQG